MKQIGKDIIEALALISSYCIASYQEDAHGKMECCDCPFYRKSGMGVGFCRLTESDKHMPKYWRNENAEVAL